MMKRAITIICATFPMLSLCGQTLEECQAAAERNYPLIRQYELIAQTTDLTLSNIQKGWLPQVTASAQATYQSDVASWPEEMKGMMSQMGISPKGLKKDQYRVGIDVTQTVFDGGTIKSRKAIAKEEGAVQTAQNEVSLYQIRQRVNEMYFSLLLLDDQLQLTEDLHTLLIASENKLSSMFRNGVASESDFNTVKAERLGVDQQLTTIRSQQRVMRQMLSTFCGIEVNHECRPPLSTVGDGNNRPELRLIDSQLRLTEAQERLLHAALMPRLSVFAQGFYGYPGYNMFDDMMHHRWTLNGMVGARLTWNIGALYTHKNDRQKLQLQRHMAENSRDLFLFNNRMEQLRQDEAISRYRQIMSTDDEIVALRSQVRRAAESKLDHGIIATDELVKELNNEHAAKLHHSTHEIELLKEIYDRKLTTNL